MQSDRLRHQNSTSPHWMENVHAIQASSDLAEPLFCFSSDPGFRGQWRVAHMRARADSLRQRKKKKSSNADGRFCIGKESEQLLAWLVTRHDACSRVWGERTFLTLCGAFVPLPRSIYDSTSIPYLLALSLAGISLRSSSLTCDRTGSAICTIQHPADALTASGRRR